METSPHSPSQASPPKAPPKPRGGIFYQLQIALGVAIVLATLFTAWTPGGKTLLPSEDGYGYRAAFHPTALPPDWPTATPRARPLIGIVAGHSGNDSGAVCPNGLTEVSINETIAAYVQKLLAAEQYDVDILQEFDTRLGGYQASAVVSIHADSCDYINDQATGFKVASALASAHPDRAARLTSCLRNRYAQTTGLTVHSTSVTNDMTSYHAFEEIHESTTAAIIEVGFMNLDNQFLTQHPDMAAQGIASGILCFLRNEDVTPATPTAAP